MRPHIEIPMEVMLEEGNSHDPYAMAIKMPPLQSINPSLHDLVTREEKKGQNTQIVRDIASEMVGRVPANLCKIFRKILSDRDVTTITCHAEEAPNLSKIPPPQQSYKRNFRIKDRRGGGAVIPCRFVLTCHESTYNKVKHYIKLSLAELNDEGTEEVEEDETKALSCPW